MRFQAVLKTPILRLCFRDFTSLELLADSQDAADSGKPMSSYLALELLGSC